MAGIREPKVVIPYREPVIGEIFLVTNREGTLTYERTEDGWEVVNFEGAEP